MPSVNSFSRKAAVVYMSTEKKKKKFLLQQPTIVDMVFMQTWMHPSNIASRVLEAFIVWQLSWFSHYLKTYDWGPYISKVFF